MANEWVKVELYGANRDGEPRSYDIADGLAVSKGTLMGLSSPRTAIAHTLNAPISGVALEDHEAGIGVTRISLWTDGEFRVVASAAIIVGAGVSAATGAVADVNEIIQTTGIAASGAVVCGHALSAAASEHDTINVRFKV